MVVVVANAFVHELGMSHHMCHCSSNMHGMFTRSTHEEASVGVPTSESAPHVWLSNTRPVHCQESQTPLPAKAASDGQRVALRTRPTSCATYEKAEAKTL